MTGKAGDLAARRQLRPTGVCLPEGPTYLEICSRWSPAEDGGVS
jgi:hypothetical protein